MKSCCPYGFSLCLKSSLMPLAVDGTYSWKKLVTNPHHSFTIININDSQDPTNHVIVPPTLKVENSELRFFFLNLLRTTSPSIGNKHVHQNKLRLREKRKETEVEREEIPFEKPFVLRFLVSQPFYNQVDQIRLTTERAI